MHLEFRLWRFTEGVRGRIFFSMAVGLLAAALGVARLALLGWLIGRVFAGATAGELVWPILGIAVVMAARGACEHWRTVVAHKTAALVQKRLRRTLFDRVAELGPSYVGRRRQRRHLQCSPRSARRGKRNGGERNAMEARHAGYGRILEISSPARGRGRARAGADHDEA